MKMDIFVRSMLCICFICSLSSAQEPGSVEGTVLNEDSKPIAAARVQVEPLGKILRSPVREIETDQSGHFVIDNLGPGSYKVFAMKESAGYPDTSFAFYSNQIFSTVTLTANIPKTNLILKIGPPAGVVDGLVTDAVTKQPIKASFLLRRASDFDNWISFSQRPRYRVLLPPNTDVILEVSSPGYRTFYYGGPSDPLERSAIHLAPSHDMRLDVQLQPVRAEGQGSR